MERFQSTHSLRSATRWHIVLIPLLVVSIHALLAECDGLKGACAITYPCFNPRTPCGVRRGNEDDVKAALMFQSTHSLRSATDDDAPAPLTLAVSIHALLAECDQPPDKMNTI